MSNLNAKSCPVKVGVNMACNESGCVWWDKDKQQCIVVSVAQKIIGK